MNNFAHTAGGRAGYTSGTPRRMRVVMSCAARLSHGLPAGPGASDEALPWGGGEYSTPHLAARASLHAAQGVVKPPTAPTAAPPREPRQGH